MGDELKITAQDLVNAMSPAVAIDKDSDEFDYVMDSLTTAAALITGALQVLLDSADDDEQSTIV